MAQTMATNPFRKTVVAQMSRIWETLKANSVIEQSHHRFLVLGHSNGLMERDRVPDKLGGLFGDPMLFKQATGRVGSIYLKSFVRTTVLLGESKIVKQGANVKQLRIVLQVLLTAKQ